MVRDARDRILNAADRLFYREGYRAVGVDTIIAESGVAKTTLYRRFPSKDHLIGAFLRRRNALYLQWIEGLVEGRDPRTALEAIFEGLASFASGPRCQGCGFLRAAGEFPEADHPGHRLAIEHKRATIERFRELAHAAGAQDPQALAEELMLVMDGTWSAARVFGPSGHASRAASAGRRLIAAHLGTTEEATD